MVSVTVVFLTVLVTVTTPWCLWMEAATIVPVLGMVADGGEDNLNYSCLAQSGVHDQEAIDFFFYTVLTRDGIGGVLAKEVLAVVLASKVLGLVLTSHWVHGGLDEGGDRVQPVDGVDGNSHPLPRSEVTTFHSVTMGMDAFLLLCSPQL